MSGREIDSKLLSVTNDGKEIKEIVANLANSKIKASDNAKVGIFVGLDEDAVARLLEEKIEAFGEVTKTQIENVLNNLLKPILDSVFAIADYSERSSNSEESYRNCLVSGMYYLSRGKFADAMREFNLARQLDRRGHEAYFGCALAQRSIQLLDVSGKDEAEDSLKIPIYCGSDGYPHNDYEELDEDPNYKFALEYSPNELVRDQYKYCVEQMK